MKMDVGRSDSSMAEGDAGRSSTALAETKYYCGWFGCQPRSLQKLHTASWFVFWLFLAGTFQSLVANGLVGVVLSTLERRFGFSSTESSWIASTYDASAVPAIILLSYYGTKGVHRPRWTAFGELLVCLGSFVFVIPHFTTDTYLPEASEVDNFLCDEEQVANRTCAVLEGASGGSEGNLRGYLAVFIAARVLHGVGAEPLFTLAVTYLDDVVTKERFSFFIAIFYVGGLIGPAIAYIAGGYALVIYTDFYSVDPDSLGFGPSDQRWVGAWWVSFLVAGIAMMLVSLPFSCYAVDLPGAAEIRAKKIPETHNMEESTIPSGGVESSEEGQNEKEITLGQIPSYLMTLICNPTFVAVTLFCICDAAIIAGFTAFGPKYVETQFSVSPALAAMVFGIITIPGGAGGLIMGGWLVKRFKLGVPGILRWTVIFTFLTLTSIFMFMLRCQAPEFAGITTGYNHSEVIGSIDDGACSSGCHCENLPFTPVCGADGIVYYSPCHAGCEHTATEGEISHYYNCSCLSGYEKEGEWEASSGSCESTSCKAFIPFVIGFLLAMTFLFACSGMLPSVIMRVVPSSHRVMALGFSSVIARLVGGLGGPLVFGWVFDEACLLKNDTCGAGASCLAYDTWRIAIYMFILCTSLKVISLIVILIGWKLYKPPRDPTLEMGAPVVVDRGVDGFVVRDFSQVYGGVVIPVRGDDTRYVKDEYRGRRASGSYELSHM